jgi:molecular chaperone HscB
VKLDDDDFALFGLPRRYALDRNELDTRWRALQAQVHPDRHAAGGATAQRLAMQWAVRINEAYQHLKDPLQRAATLCRLAGVPLDAEVNTAMPPAFLVQQMQWREALEDADGRAEVERLEAEVALTQARLTMELAASLDERADAETAAGLVRALMFVRRFEHDLESRLEAFEA